MLIDLFIICSITLVAPFYDCDEQWAVLVYDTVTVQCADGRHTFGCAVFDLEVQTKCLNGMYSEGCLLDDYPQIRNMKYIQMGTIKKDSYGQPLLWHELLHLSCECNWHVEKEPIEKFQNLEEKT